MRKKPDTRLIKNLEHSDFGIFIDDFFMYEMITNKRLI
jgi:hypothetical protein